MTLTSALQDPLKQLSLDDRVHCTHDYCADATLHSEFLMQPMQRHMLPCLPLEAMASLRASCKTLQYLVDDASAEAWQPAASGSLLPNYLQPVSTLCADSSSVQHMLRKQGQTIGNLRNGARSRRQHFLHEHHTMQAMSLQWAPGWPSRYIAMMLEWHDPDAYGPMPGGRP